MMCWYRCIPKPSFYFLQSSSREGESSVVGTISHLISFFLSALTAIFSCFLKNMGLLQFLHLYKEFIPVSKQKQEDLAFLSWLCQISFSNLHFIYICSRVKSVFISHDGWVKKCFKTDPIQDEIHKVNQVLKDLFYNLKVFFSWISPIWMEIYS